jgi:hypothetical protein
MIARHKQVVESVTRFEQSIEATQFLATLTLEGWDGLGDSATLLAQEIVRDAVTGEIVAVVAFASEEEVQPGEDTAGRGPSRRVSKKEMCRAIGGMLLPRWLQSGCKAPRLYYFA